MTKILFISFLATSLSWGQDYGKDITNVLSEFSGLESYYIEAKVTVNGEETYGFEASVKSSKKYGSYIKVDINEMLVNHDYAIAVDHEDQTIRVDQGDFAAPKEKGSQDIGLDQLAEMINDNVSVSFLGKTDVYRTYRISGNGNMAETIVKINNKTGFFHEIQIFYDDDNLSFSSYKVRYTKFLKNPDFDRKEFDEKQIITKSKNGRMHASSRYSGYVVIE